MQFQFNEKNDNWLRDVSESDTPTVNETQKKVDAEFE